MRSNRFRLIFVRCVAVAVAVVACVALIASVQVYLRIANAEETARTQLQMTSANIAQAADSVHMASDAIANGSTTATNAQTAVAAATTIVQNASQSIATAGSAVGFTIPGTNIRPFGNTEDSIKRQAAQVAALADALNRTAASLGTNAADLRVIAADVAGVATRLDEVSRSVALFAGDGTGTGGLTKLAGAAQASAVVTMVLAVLSICVAGALWLLATGGPSLAEVTDAVAARLAERALPVPAPSVAQAATEDHPVAASPTAAESTDVLPAAAEQTDRLPERADAPPEA